MLLFSRRYRDAHVYTIPERFEDVQVDKWWLAVNPDSDLWRSQRTGDDGRFPVANDIIIYLPSAPTQLARCVRDNSYSWGDCPCISSKFA